MRSMGTVHLAVMKSSAASAVILVNIDHMSYTDSVATIKYGKVTTCHSILWNIICCHVLLPAGAFMAFMEQAIVLICEFVIGE